MTSVPLPVVLASLLLVPLVSGCIDGQDFGATLASVNVDLVDPFAIEPLAEGIDRPVQFIPFGAEPDTFLVAEMAGTIRIVTSTGVAAEPWLNISDRLANDHREQGLLGLALHPLYPDDPRVFVTYTARDHDVVLASFEGLTDTPIDTTTEQILLRVPQYKPYHNGGHIAFGPDRLLYAAFGDGSPQGDPDGNAQDLASLLGTIIRIDVDQDDGSGTGWSVPADNPFVGREGRDEIWLYGLRNPWRFSFDAVTGDLWIGDVGFLAVEEIDRVSPALGGGHNLGWPRWEGSRIFAQDRPIDVPVLFPVHEYDREEPCSSVSGGFVYRGESLPVLHGDYVFADFCTGAVRALSQDGGRWVSRDIVRTGLPVVGFGEGPDGALYVLSYIGGIYRLVAAQ